LTSLKLKISNTQRGQGMGEYGLVLALIALVCISGLQILGSSLSQKLIDISSSVNNVSTKGKVSHRPSLPVLVTPGKAPTLVTGGDGRHPNL